MAKNGYACHASGKDKYDKMIALASSEMGEDEFAAWLRGVCSEM